MLDDVAETWREFSPVGTGRYRSHVQTERKRARLTAAALRKGVVVGRVFNDDDEDKVAAIEYGTSDTEAFAPMRHTYARFMN